MLLRLNPYEIRKRAEENTVSTATDDEFRGYVAKRTQRKNIFHTAADGGFNLVLRALQLRNIMCPGITRIAACSGYCVRHR